MLSFRGGRRRRPVQVYRTDPPPPAAAGSPTVPPRMVVTRVRPRPWIPTRITSARTASPAIGTVSTRAPILVVRRPIAAAAPLPAVVVRPLASSLPNVLPPQQRARPRPLVVRDLYWAARPRPVITATPGPVTATPGDITNTPYPRPLVLRLRSGPRARRALPPIVVGSTRVAALALSPTVSGQWSVVRKYRDRDLQHWPRPIVVTSSPRGQGASPRPRVPIVLRLPPPPASRLAGRIARVGSERHPRMVGPRPLVVPAPRRVWRPTPATVLGAGSSSAAGSGRLVTLPLRPLFVRPPAGIRLPAKLIAPVVHHPLASPARHDPRSLIAVFGRRPPSTAPSYRVTIISPAQPIPIVNPPVVGPALLPPDLVAAAIAWLRLQPAIVAAFGDAVATEKFGSDIAARGTAPPYLEFFEPEEDESYESADGTGKASSLAEGFLACEIVGPQSLGKLGTRQLADAVARVLNDAPLVFADGVLVYLRRSKRKYPTFKESGPGGNVVVWKRVLEFKYQIERWAPNF